MTTLLQETQKWMLVRGNTMPYRQALRAAGGEWLREERAWRFPYDACLADRIVRTDSDLHVEFEELPVPAAAGTRTRSPYVRARLIAMPLIVNMQERLAVIGSWYDLEDCPGADGFHRCHPVVEDATQATFFTCSTRSLNKCFESQL